MFNPVRLFIAVSLDGYIADSSGSVAWLAPFEDQDYGYPAFIEQVGLIVMGRTTFDHIGTFGDWPYIGRPCLVLTSSPLPDAAPAGVSAWSQAVGALIARVREVGDGDVWVVGGGLTISTFLQHAAVDQMDLFVMPVFLGQGVPLFPAGPPLRPPTLARHKEYSSGVVQLTYRFQARIC